MNTIACGKNYSLFLVFIVSDVPTVLGVSERLLCESKSRGQWSSFLHDELRGNVWLQQQLIQFWKQQPYAQGPFQICFSKSETLGSERKQNKVIYSGAGPIHSTHFVSFPGM